jgi:lysophospholipase L1-like esterase
MKTTKTRMSGAPLARIPLSLAVASALALLSARPAAAQFDKYVALGDSLTAGFQSNCLVQRNQVNSYPAQIARALGITDFEQPLVQEIGLTSPLVGNACLGPSFSPPASITVVPVSQMGPPLNAALPRPYDNLGMPGANVADLTQLRHGDPNGTSIQRIAALVLRNVPGSPFDGLNAVDEADLLLTTSTGPNLLTLWIGNNDVLGAATSGVVVDGVTLTPVDAFTAAYQAIVDAIPPNVTLVKANIPDVTAIPFTTTIPPVLVDPTTRQPVVIGGQLVPLLGPGDDAFPCTPVPPDQGCALPSGTLVTLPAAALLAQGVGVPTAAGGTGTPLPHGRFVPPATVVPGVVLYPDEVALLQDRVDAYNEVIAGIAPSAVLVDIHGFFQDVVAHGYEIGGVTLTTSFLTGGIFSYDGVHPSSIGYAVVADQFIQAINAQAGTDIPRPNLGTILFTPNVPAVSGAVQGSRSPGYDSSLWRNAMDEAGVTSRFQVRLPSTSDPRPPRGLTRSLRRPAD